MRYVGKTEYEFWQKKKEEEILRRREEEANKGKKKDAKKPVVEEKIPVFDKTEEQNVALEEVVQEPENKSVEKTEISINLKFSGVADFAKYEVEPASIHFLPTMMFT